MSLCSIIYLPHLAPHMQVVTIMIDHRILSVTHKKDFSQANSVNIV